MNAILIYPKFPDTFWSFTYALGFIGKRSAFPPLGLLTVASLLPADWSKRLVDLNVEGLTEKGLAWADMAVIGGMAVQSESLVVNNFSGDNVDGKTNIIPRMGMDKILEGYRTIMEHINAPKNYYKRVRTLLMDLKAPDVLDPEPQTQTVVRGHHPFHLRLSLSAGV